MEKIWLKNYEPGVPHEINPDEYPCVVSLLQSACENYNQRIAFSNFQTEITYQHFSEKAHQLAAFLQSLGLKKGDRVALMLPNILQYPIGFFGILLAGLVVVNINPLYTCDELLYQLTDAQPKAIIILTNFAHTLEKIYEKTTVKHIILTQLGDCLGSFKGTMANLMLRYVQKKIPDYQLPHAIDFRKALKKGAHSTLIPPLLTGEDTALLQYTGGTTGVIKGAILTHKNLVSNILQSEAWLTPLLKKIDNLVIVTPLPLYHIFSLMANCLTFIKLGGKNILITNPRDIRHFIHEIQHSKLSFLTGVNTLFNALLHHKSFKEIDFSYLKGTLAGGTALQHSTALQWRLKTNTPIFEGYGLTETSPAITITPFNLEESKGSVGIPIPSTDISIRDEEGHELGINVSGELCVKGPQVMKGYWKQSKETQHVFWKDGFLRTGDIARVDEEGFVYIVDRSKDMIDVSGFNVYPTEVEQVISLLPGVLEVGVVGIKHDSNERVKACIVKSNPYLTKEDVIAHCQKHLTAYKIPKIIEFYDELPKNAVGKILRRLLKNP